MPPGGEYVCKRQTGRLSDVPAKTESRVVVTGTGGCGGGGCVGS